MINYSHSIRFIAEKSYSDQILNKIEDILQTNYLYLCRVSYILATKQHEQELLIHLILRLHCRPQFRVVPAGVMAKCTQFLLSLNRCSNMFIVQ